jgi:hypothetical protein
VLLYLWADRCRRPFIEAQASDTHYMFIAPGLKAFAERLNGTTPTIKVS